MQCGASSDIATDAYATRCTYLSSKAEARPKLCTYAAHFMIDEEDLVCPASESFSQDAAIANPQSQRKAWPAVGWSQADALYSTEALRGLHCQAFLGSSQNICNKPRGKTNKLLAVVSANREASTKHAAPAIHNGTQILRTNRYIDCIRSSGFLKQARNPGPTRLSLPARGI